MGSSDGAVAHCTCLEETLSILKVFLAVQGKRGIALQLGTAWTELACHQIPSQFPQFSHSHRYNLPGVLPYFNI